MLIGNKDVTNPLEVIECIIAFNSKDYSKNYRDRMLYAIIFGWDDESYTKFGWDEQTINEYKELHKRFEELSKLNQKREWIPCNERLPEESNSYEVTIEYDSKQLTRTAYYSIKEGRWSTYTNYVTAWRERLSEPYKEE